MNKLSKLLLILKTLTTAGLGLNILLLSVYFRTKTNNIEMLFLDIFLMLFTLYFFSKGIENFGTDKEVAEK